MRPLELVSKPVNNEEDAVFDSRRNSHFSSSSIPNPNVMNNIPSMPQIKVGFFTTDEVLKEEDEYEQRSQSRSRTSSQKTEEEKCDVMNNDTNALKQTSKDDKLKDATNEEQKQGNFISRAFSNNSNPIRS